MGVRPRGDVPRPVHRDAAVEEARPPQLPERVGHRSVDRPVDGEPASRRRGNGAVTGGRGVLLAVSRRRVEDRSDLAVAHDEEQLPAEVDLDPVSLECRPGTDAIGESTRRLRPDDPVTADARRLLPRKERLLRERTEGTVRLLEPVAELAQAL